jgi:drug/metabolite transporter (DMT)-like permease
MLDDKIVGMAAALGSAASWAVGSVLFKILGDKLQPIPLTFAKGVVGVVMLGLALIFVGPRSIEAQPLLLLTLSGILGIAIGDTFFFMALRNLGAHTIVVLLTLGQLLTVLLALVWLGERPNAVQCVGIALVLSGVATVMWVRLSGDQGSSKFVGVAWGLAAVVCMAVSVIIAKEALENTDSIEASFIRMIAGTVGIFLFGQATRQMGTSLKFLLDIRFGGFFVFSVFVVTFGGFWLSLVAIEKTDVSIANTLNSTEPLFVLPLAAFVLKEVITVWVVVGSTLAVLGIILLAVQW